jgi:peroxiredoxin
VTSILEFASWSAQKQTAVMETAIDPSTVYNATLGQAYPLDYTPVQLQGFSDLTASTTNANVSYAGVSYNYQSATEPLPETL